MYRYHYSCEIKTPHSTNYNITFLGVMPCSLPNAHQFSFQTLSYIYIGEDSGFHYWSNRLSEASNCIKLPLTISVDFFMHNNQLSTCQGSQFRLSLYMYRYNSHIPMDNAISPTFISAMAFGCVLEFSTFSHYPKLHSTL
jgi:hypothetical protein